MRISQRSQNIFDQNRDEGFKRSCNSMPVREERTESEIHLTPPMKAAAMPFVLTLVLVVALIKL